MLTVRDVTFDVLRRHGMTTLFANPGSTEVPLLCGLPDDLSFVLALHEGSVVGMATGVAIATRRPALALLHTTAGLGNAVGAIATARVNRAPLVVIVGQQDRRHLALEPFLTGRLAGLAGDYPVWFDQPPRAQDVPGAIARAWHEAQTWRGPALVVVPMDDWPAEMDPHEVIAAPRQLIRAGRPPELRDTLGTSAAPDMRDVLAIDLHSSADVVPELAALVAEARTPVIVAGSGADSSRTWAALVALAEHLGCPVWQESFGARAGFPQDHALHAGVLPAGRAQQRAALGGHDLVLVVGAAALRHYPYQPGPLVEEGTRIAVVTDDPAEAHRSPADLAVLGPPATVCEGLLAELGVPAEAGRTWRTGERDPGVTGPGPGEPMSARHVLAALAVRLAPDTVVVEETPSSRPDLHRILPARRPLGFVSAAMGGLGFALPAAVGLRMAAPERPMVAVVGDGSAIYGVQALWSAVRYQVGALFVVLANGRYAVMDRLADMHEGGKAPWPSFEEVSLSGLARSFGCPAIRVEDHDHLLAVLDEVVPTLPTRTEPLLLDVAVVPDTVFRP
ncbi:thiamine pyrophosphate-dependent enzyme [Nonomuraea soli]|uniref:Benzoylformate decarboxylase n=1 Tax=Nonomuraea soli TaxID=1032476 RepID=A0A7W0HTF9_9ACTN|nr:thiamine pyrophosphate-dependent enzyme [Nonomuraea soli]MBA2894985.1 benzoylformate decarboxylase [Nonomuraea soli]